MTYYTQQNSYFNREPKCLSPKLAMVLNNAAVYGGAEPTVGDRYDFDFIVKIDDRHMLLPKVISANKEAMEKLPEKLITPQMPPVISIVWPDFGAPSLQASWWGELYSFIKTLGTKQNNARVLIHCIGGRGRTGTALSILLGLHMKAHNLDGNPVNVVRSSYCSTAVESMAQIEYIQAITGFDLTGTPSAFQIEKAERDKKDDERQAKLDNFSAKAKPRRKKRHKKGKYNSEYSVVVSKKKSIEDFKDTDLVEIDEEDDTIWVNGELYEGDDLGFYMEKKSWQMKKGISVKNAGNVSQEASATPDYTGPSHRMGQHG